jgi:hypothetical protein
MRFRHLPSASGAVLGAVLACSETPTERPAALRLPDGEPPYITGVIERIDDSRALFTDSTRLQLCARGWGGIVPSTVIEDDRGRRLAPDDLHVGDRAAVWTDGAVAESCPSQFRARRVRVRR